MTQRIGVGLIGAGFIGQVHIEALRRLGFVEVVAIATSNEETARKKAKALSIPKAYANYQDLIDDDEVQVVQIASPTHLHFPQAKAALEAGKHVVCEKPLALNSEESSELVGIARDKELVNAVSFNHRFFPLVQQSRALVQRGALGSIYLVQGGFLQDCFLYDTDYNWRMEASKGGQLRTVGDLGSHWMDMVEFVTFLKVDSVLADLTTFMPVRKKPKKGSSEIFARRATQDSGEYEEVEIDTEDLAIMLLRFVNSEARGVAIFSEVAVGRKSRPFFEIYGANSGIAWDGESANELWIGHRDRPNEILRKCDALLDEPARKYMSYPGAQAEGYLDTHLQCNRAIYEYIRGQKHKNGVTPDFPTFEDGYRQELLCEAVLKSARSDRWVKVRDPRGPDKDNIRR